MPTITMTDDHQYSIDGKDVPSVTQVITDIMGELPYGDEWYMERGSACHELYKMLAGGVDLEGYEYDPRLHSYILGWLAWHQAMQPNFTATETQVASVIHSYAGTLDAILSGGALIDYKASANPERDRLQLGGYAFAWNEDSDHASCKIKRAYIVEIPGNGFYKCGHVYSGAELRRASTDFLTLRRAYMIKTGR